MAPLHRSRTARHSLRRSLSLTISLIVLFLFSFSASAQDVRLSASAEAAIIADLESGDEERIASSLRHLPHPYTEESYPEHDPFYKDRISRQLALALIEASIEQTDIAFNTPSDHGDEPLGMFLAIDYVAALRMPEAIPALLKAMQFGNTAAWALAEFGPDISYTIIEYIDSPERTFKEITGGLLALVRTVETWRPLDPALHDTLRELSIRHMQGYTPEHLPPSDIEDFSDVSIGRGMFLASVLGDEDLKEMVMSLSDGSFMIEWFIENWYDPDDPDWESLDPSLRDRLIRREQLREKVQNAER